MVCKYVCVCVCVCVCVFVCLGYEDHASCLSKLQYTNCFTNHPQMLSAALVVNDGTRYSDYTDSVYNLRATADILYHDYFRHLYGPSTIHCLFFILSIYLSMCLSVRPSA